MSLSVSLLVRGSDALVAGGLSEPPSRRLPPPTHPTDLPPFRRVRSPAAKMAEERALHEAKLAKMENEMKMVFQQKVNEKEAKLKQSEEELYARHREMKEALEKQRLELEDKKRRIEQGRPLTPEKVQSPHHFRRHPRCG